ncbi:MAG: 2-oxo-4-hydroxy-4-carboxy-5-ureidoimidazoline decarboxylase [Cyanobacteria bacterium]|nr:2-oxo-4-hydroxy-4-carboxy-5-ureidoimidazoline decarboxylase [Cyanobacteriota bacterium]MDA0865081.1 2-oxo-4-hydroxy-4-carboxy-5-ureidoimidazoline decarboxylase [Cyanobacteriota bacterium]
MSHTLTEINQMDQATFVAVLGPVFENTPHIAQQVWGDRPFQTVADLHERMVAVVTAMAPAEQLALIQAHPDLGSRLQMAPASVAEQAGAGLSQLSAAEYERFHQLNTAYQQKFGFPFVMAVKGQTKAAILAAFQTRLDHSLDQEQQKALAEIGHIAGFRLEATITSG